ncbi:MAG: tetratricopeptide repeat protein [Gammaproteobacteria bacterium]|nr:tetratricopeptide repeat protein [Gammaproteobacteria bacterium]
MKSCNSIHALFLLLGCLLLAACGGVPSRQATGPAPTAAAAPREAHAEFERALDLMREKRYAEAAPALEAMTRRYPDLAGPYLNLGIAYSRLDRFDEAESALRRALEIDPGNAEAYNLLGLAHRGAGRFQEARADYEQALKLDPLFADVHLNLAILFDLYLGQPRTALQYYERYQELSGGEDKQVKLWIADLKQRLPAAAPGAEGDGP